MPHDSPPSLTARPLRSITRTGLGSPKTEILHEPEPARLRKVVLTSQFYQDVVAGNDSFLVRPIMNILGKDLRPVSTRARAQGGAGGLLWAFFPGTISADEHLLRSCPYGDPGDQLLIVTPDVKDAPLTVTVLESYPHRVCATTDKFLQGLHPSQWSRLGGVQNFLEHWERSFGRVFKLAYEPWAWIVRFGSLTPPVEEPVPVDPEPRARTGLFSRWAQRLVDKKPEPAPPAPESAPMLAAPADSRQLVAAQRNALACLENAIKARREGNSDEGWRMLNVAYRILSRTAKPE